VEEQEKKKIRKVKEWNYNFSSGRRIEEGKKKSRMIGTFKNN
jgi:hypothetical protein